MLARLDEFNIVRVAQQCARQYPASAFNTLLTDVVEMQRSPTRTTVHQLERVRRGRHGHPCQRETEAYSSVSFAPNDFARQQITFSLSRHFSRFGPPIRNTSNQIRCGIRNNGFVFMP